MVVNLRQSNVRLSGLTQAFCSVNYNADILWDINLQTRSYI